MRRSGKGKPRTGPVIRAHAGLIQTRRVIRSEALEQVVLESPVLARTIGDLVALEMVHPRGNAYVLVDVDRVLMRCVNTSKRSSSVYPPL